MSQSVWAAELLRDAPEGPVLELCAGVGHIGLLAVAEQERDLVLVDLDDTACGHARSNAAAARLRGSVTVRCDRVENALKPDEAFAFVIADPPWVPSGATGLFPADPLNAIDGGEDGLTVARACLDVIGRHLLVGGAAILQLGTEGQAATIRRQLEKHPEHGLEVVEVRSRADNGVLVHLSR